MTACNLFVWGFKLFNKRNIGRKLSILFIAKYYSFVKILSYTASDMFKVWRKGFLDCRLGIRVSGCLGVGVLCQQDSDFGPYLYLQAPKILPSFQTFVIMWLHCTGGYKSFIYLFLSIYYLFCRSKYYRQTLLFSSFVSPEMNSLFNRHCYNILLQFISLLLFIQLFKSVIVHYCQNSRLTFSWFDTL